MASNAAADKFDGLAHEWMRIYKPKLLNSISAPALEILDGTHTEPDPALAPPRPGSTIHFTIPKGTTQDQVNRREQYAVMVGADITDSTIKKLSSAQLVNWAIDNEQPLTETELMDLRAKQKVAWDLWMADKKRFDDANSDGRAKLLGMISPYIESIHLTPTLGENPIQSFKQLFDDMDTMYTISPENEERIRTHALKKLQKYDMTNQSFQTAWKGMYRLAKEAGLQVTRIGTGEGAAQMKIALEGALRRSGQWTRVAAKMSEDFLKLPAMISYLKEVDDERATNKDEGPRVTVDQDNGQAILQVNTSNKRSRDSYHHNSGSNRKQEFNQEQRKRDRQNLNFRAFSKEAKIARGGTCFNCNKVGHKAEDCRNKRCGSCGANPTNHTYWTCPKRKKTDPITTFQGNNHDKDKGGGSGGKRDDRGSDSRVRQVRISNQKTNSHYSSDGSSAAGGGTHDADAETHNVPPQDPENNFCPPCSLNCCLKGHTPAFYVDSPSGLGIRLNRCDISPLSAVLDTGADISAVPTGALPLYNASNNDTSKTAYTASGQPLTLGPRMGDYSPVIRDLTEVNELNDILLSGRSLQRQGNWIICPPEKHGGGSLVIKDSNQFINIATDANYRFDISQPTQHRHRKRKITALSELAKQLPLPIMENQHQPASIYALQSRHMPTNSVARLIEFWHEVLGHVSQEKMLDIARSGSIDGFSLTPAQIRDNWVDCVHCLRGNMVAAPTPQRSTNSRPLRIGESVQVDAYGSIKVKSVGGNDTMYNFIDRSCGYVFSYFAKTKSEVTALAAIQAAVTHFALHKHVMEELTGDADPIISTTTVSDLCARLQVRHRVAAPFAHEGIGTVEAFHKALGNRVTTAYDRAPWMPKSLWSYACALVVLQYNFTPNNKTVGTTPYAMFTTRKPDINKRPMLPFGQPMEVLDNPKSRKWHFGAKTRTVMYLGPTMRTSHSIICYDPLLKQILTRRSFHVLDRVPAAWLPLHSADHMSQDIIPEDPDTVTLSGPVNDTLLNEDDEAGTLDDSDPPPVSGEWPDHPPREQGPSSTEDPVPCPAWDGGTDLTHDPSSVTTESGQSTCDDTPGSPADPGETAAMNGPGDTPPSQTPTGARSRAPQDPILQTSLHGECDPIPTTAGSTYTASQQHPSAQNSSPPHISPPDIPENTAASSPPRIFSPRNPEDIATSSSQHIFPSHKPENTTPSSTSHIPHSHNPENTDTPSKDHFPPLRRSARAHGGQPGRWANTDLRSGSNRHFRRLTLILRKLSRKAGNPRKFNDEDAPQLTKALNSTDRGKWIKAIQDELKQMGVMEVYDLLLSKPIGVDILPCHLILKKKRDSNGEISKFKARLVGGGHRQTKEMYDSTGSPTARIASIKIILQLTASRAMHFKSVDITGAYLHADIDRELYISIPDIDGRGIKYARLKKSLYGLKQSGRLWYENLKKTLTHDIGAIQSDADKCVFTLMGNDGEITYIAVHVDDLFITSTSEQALDTVISILQKRYGEITESDANTHLGINIQRLSSGDISMSQPGLIRKAYMELGLSSAFPEDLSNNSRKHIPMTARYVDSISTDTSELLGSNDRELFQRIVGMLIYITHSRPDILYAVSMLSGRSSAPRKADLEAATRTVTYLYQSIYLGLTFSADADIQLFGYADAAFASAADQYRSHSGYTLHLGSAPFAAYSKRQTIVSLSTTESELEALRAETTLTIWALNLLNDLGYQQTGPVTIFEDNNAAITMLATDFSGGSWARTRHYGVRYEFIKSHIESHTINLEHCPTVDMVADILTKPLERPAFEKLRNFLLGLRPLSMWQEWN